MVKFTNAPAIGAVVGSVTLKTTVEVVIWPEPCTPIAPGVADMNWIPPAAPGGGVPPVVVPPVVVPPVVVPPVVPPVVVPPVVPPPVVPPVVVPGPNPPEFVPVLSEPPQPAIASVAANKRAAITELPWFFMI